jgi:hypothetical protein
MKYYLLEEHYNNLSYFHKELYKNDIYDIDLDYLVLDFKNDLIIKVLDYYTNDNLDFIDDDNYKEVFEIFFHFGSEIGLLFCFHNGNLKKELDKIKNIDPKNENYEELKKDYEKIIKFKSYMYNYDIIGKYGKIIQIFFKETNFNMEILNYENYNIKINKIQKMHEINKDKKYYRIMFDCYFNESIKKLSLHKSLTHITFNYYFNQPIKKNFLPESLEYLVFGTYFNQPIKKNSLPKSLRVLIFGLYFNQSIEIDSLPKSLKYISFGLKYDKLIKKDVLPKSLKYIKINNTLLDKSYINNSIQIE